MAALVERAIAKTLVEDWIAGTGEISRGAMRMLVDARRQAAMAGDADIREIALYILDEVEERFDDLPGKPS